jgi:hypothetical protein
MCLLKFDREIFLDCSFPPLCSLGDRPDRWFKHCLVTCHSSTAPCNVRNPQERYGLCYKTVSPGRYHSIQRAGAARKRRHWPCEEPYSYAGLTAILPLALKMRSLCAVVFTLVSAATLLQSSRPGGFIWVERRRKEWIVGRRTQELWIHLRRGRTAAKDGSGEGCTEGRLEGTAGGSCEQVGGRKHVQTDGLTYGQMDAWIDGRMEWKCDDDDDDVC